MSRLRQTAAVLTLVVAVAGLLAGCSKPVRLDIKGEHHGYVVQRDYWDTKSGRQRYVVIRDDSDGHNWKIIVRRSAWDRCPAGAYWPTCKTGKPQ